MIKKEIKTESADSFKDENGYYVFPFEVLDKTPGGSNLGRIEWCIEPIRGKKKQGRIMIEKLLVWAKQTRDERYVGKIFEIPCHTEAITGDSIDRNSFLNHVWYWYFCPDHNTVGMWAYPRNEHSKMVINCGSSFGVTAEFK